MFDAQVELTGFAVPSGAVAQKPIFRLYVFTKPGIAISDNLEQKIRNNQFGEWVPAEGVEYVDLGDDASKLKFRQWQIFIVPTLVTTKLNGDEIDRLISPKNDAAVEAFLKKSLGNATQSQ